MRTQNALETGGRENRDSSRPFLPPGKANAGTPGSAKRTRNTGSKSSFGSSTGFGLSARPRQPERDQGAAPAASSCSASSARGAPRSHKWQCCLGFVFRIAISVFLILLVASSMLGGRRADVPRLHRGLLCPRLAFVWQCVSQHGSVYQNGRIAVCFGNFKDANPRSGCLLVEDGLKIGCDVRCAGDTDAVIERVWSMKLKRDGVGCTSGFP